MEGYFRFSKSDIESLFCPFICPNQAFLCGFGMQGKKQRDQSSKALVSFCNALICKNLLTSLVAELGESLAFLESL